jgi:Spy/CpxP family protein refolding chaperone
MMRRITFVWLTTLLLAVTSFAQVARPTQRAPRGGDAPVPLRGEQKLRYLVKQLDLGPQDHEFVQGLLEVYAEQVQTQKVEQEERGDLLERVRVLYAKMGEAEQAGDTSRAEELREQMKLLGPGVLAEREFFAALEVNLSEDQKAALKKARQRLRRVPDGALRPIDVLKTAQALELAPEQDSKLSKLLQEYRAYMKGQAGRLYEPARQLAIQRIITDIRGILTTEQTEPFDKQIEKLRPPAPAPAQPEQERPSESGIPTGESEGGQTP